MTHSPLLGPGLFFSFVVTFTQTVGLLGRAINPSQGLYLHRTAQSHNKHTHTDIHALSGIRTHDPSVREGEDSSCSRQRGHCDRLLSLYKSKILPLLLWRGHQPITSCLSINTRSIQRRYLHARHVQYRTFSHLHSRDYTKNLEQRNVGFAVLTAVVMKTSIFRDIW
jgi:hypothetical protein